MKRFTGVLVGLLLLQVVEGGLAVAADLELKIDDVKTGYFTNFRSGEQTPGLFADMFSVALKRDLDLNLAGGLIDQENDRRGVGIIHADIVQILNEFGRMIGRKVNYKQPERFNLGFYLEINGRLNPFNDDFKPEGGGFVTIELFKM